MKDRMAIQNKKISSFFDSRLGCMVQVGFGFVRWFIRARRRASALLLFYTKNAAQ